MHYSVKETKEAIEDVSSMAVYMIEKFKNHKAAFDFIDKYDKESSVLGHFPFEYRGYAIRMKPFDTYNIFFIIDTSEMVVIILANCANMKFFIALGELDKKYPSSCNDWFLENANPYKYSVELCVHPQGVHGFDYANDDEYTKEIIEKTIEFIKN